MNQRAYAWGMSSGFVRVGIFKDPASATTHFVGFAFSLLGTAWLLSGELVEGRRGAAWVYCVALTALFLASSCYHFFDLGTRGNRVLQRLDHAAIYGLIAGTYVPVLMATLQGATRLWMLAVVVGVALVGASFKLLGLRLPDVVDAALYVALGWSCLLVAPSLFRQLSSAQLVPLVVGGVSFTVGAVVYALERPDPVPGVFGHHEVWHVFVLIGATSHFVIVSDLLLR